MKNPLKKRFIILIAVFLITGISYSFILPRIFNSQKILSLITQNLPKDYEVKTKNFKTRFSWNLELNLSADEIELDKQKNTLVSADNLKLRLALLPLLNKDIFIKKLETESLNISAKYPQDRDIWKYFPKPGTNKQKFKLNKLKIDSYNISINDTIKNKISSLEGENLKLSKYFLSDNYKASTQGKILLNGTEVSNFEAKTAKNRTNVKLNKIDISMIIPYISDILPYQISNGKGILNLDLNTDRNSNFKIKSDIKNLFVYDRKKAALLSINDDFNLETNGHFSSKKIKIKSFIAKSKDYNLSLKGTVSNLGKKRKHFDLEITTENSDVKKLLGLWPKWIDIKGNSIKKFYSSNIKGHVTSNLLAKFERNYPEYYGQLLVRDMSIADFGGNGSQMVLSFNDDSLKIRSNLIDGKDKTITVNGDIRMFHDKMIDVDVATTTVDLDKVQKITSILSSICKFPIGPLKDITLSGNGEANLKIKYRRAVDIKGKVNVNNAPTITHKDLALPVNDGKGTLVFDGEKIDYNLSGLFRSTPIKFSGYSMIGDNNDILIETTSTPLDSALFLVQNSKMLEPVKNSLKILKKAGGSGDFSIKLTGEDRLKPEGTLTTQNASALLDGFSQELTGVSSSIFFNDKKVEFKDVSANIAGSNIRLNGNIEGDNLLLSIKSQELDMGGAVELISKSPILSSVKNALKDVSSLNGKTQAEIDLKGKLKDTNLLDKAYFNVIKGNITFKNFDEEISLNKGDLNITKDKLQLNPTQITMLGTKGIAKGDITVKNNKPVPNISVLFPYASKNAVNSLKTASYIPKETRNILAELKDVRGGARAIVTIKNDFLPETQLKFNDFNAIYSSKNAPFKINSGAANIDKTQNINLEDISGYLGGSSFNTSGKIDKSGNYNLLYSSVVTPDDAVKYINKFIPSPVEIKIATPLSGSFSGNKDNWGLSLEVILNEENAVSYKGATVNSPKKRFIIANIYKNKNLIRFVNTGIKEVVGEYPKDNCLINCAEKYNTKNIVRLDGYLSSNNSGRIRLIADDYLDANLLNVASNNDNKFFEQGKFKGNVDISLSEKSHKILGHLQIADAYVNELQTLIKQADLRFSPNVINVDNCILKIADSDIKMNATIDNDIQTPYKFRTVDLTSNNINIDELFNTFKNKTKTDDSKTPLFTIEKGTLNANKLIFNNLITNNTNILFDFGNDWILNLSQITLDTAGGKITGKAKINFLTTDVNSSLNFENMLANAAASTFLQIQNEIYGVLNGELNFKTKGSTTSDLIKHSNGSGQFKITSGRLVRLGSMEYLLRAGNIAQAGITGLNLNNLLDLLAPQKTGCFDTITSDLKIKNGVLSTDNLISKSQNLNLYIVGSFDMETNYADLTVLGRLPKKIEGVLGPAGSFSINSMFEVIPGIDASDSTIAVLVPTLNKIPGFEFDNSKYRRFVVNIEGDFYNPTSVKKFRWLK